MTSRTRALMLMVKREWQRHGATARAGVSDAMIEAFERKHGTQLPEAVADYFRVVDGMNENETDQLGIRFWSLGELRPAAEELPAAEPGPLKNYFVFADFLLWSHGYAVRLGQAEDDVIIVGGDSPIAVAPSFHDFLELYLRQPDGLFL